MRPQAKPLFHIGCARRELVLRLADGTPWVLSVSPGIERFIGFYPRVDGIGSDGPLLSFRSVDPASV